MNPPGGQKTGGLGQVTPPHSQLSLSASVLAPICAFLLLMKLLAERVKAARGSAKMHVDGKRFDYVICGGGASGCYAAALLR